MIEYIRSRKSVPAARQLTTRYPIGSSIAAILWFVSAFVPALIRIIFWILELGVDIETPLLFARQLSVQHAPHAHHLTERFGSFTIIVLGISILGVVNGIADHNWTTPSMISTGLGLGIAFSLWWIYFDTMDGSEIRALRENKQIGIYFTWLYIHFPLIIGFTALGVAIEHVVISNQALPLSSSDKWLVCISTFLCLVTLGVIQMTSAITTSTTNSISSPSSSSSPSASSSSTRKATAISTSTYAAPIYSIVAASPVLMLGFTIVDSILVMPAFLICVIAIACIGRVILDLKRHPHHRISKS